MGYRNWESSVDVWSVGCMVSSLFPFLLRCWFLVLVFGFRFSVCTGDIVSTTRAWIDSDRGLEVHNLAIIVGFFHDSPRPRWQSVRPLSGVFLSSVSRPERLSFSLGGRWIIAFLALASPASCRRPRSTSVIRASS